MRANRGTKVNKVRKNRKKMKLFGSYRNIAVLMCVFFAAISTYVYIYSHPIKPIFPIKHVDYIGNRHLTDDELSTLSGVRVNDSLIMLSGKKISGRLFRSPWIKSVSLMKELPDTLAITVKEAQPFALLDMNEHLFLIDERGNLLEEFKGDAVPFLPVITCDPSKENQGFSAALSLVRLMDHKGFLSEGDNIWIMAHNAEDLSVTIDDLVVKIGAGGYEKKLDRLARLEEEIKKMGIYVDYIDLRFSDRAIVKPVTDKVVK
jgi:cell division protein FtsQ